MRREMPKFNKFAMNSNLKKCTSTSFFLKLGWGDYVLDGNYELQLEIANDINWFK